MVYSVENNKSGPNAKNYIDFVTFTFGSSINLEGDMNKYLTGYLSSIPKFDYDRVVKFLQENIATKMGINSGEFETILNQINLQATPATKSIDIDYGARPSSTYNTFYSNAYVDLTYLYKIIGLLYDAIDSYSNLSSSYISDIKGEIDRLEILINDIEMKKQFSQNTIIVTETFSNVGSFEEYNDENAYLFTDRDGSNLSIVEDVHNSSYSSICLKPKNIVDLIHGTDGSTKAKIQVIDYRGIPVSTFSTKENAIDNSGQSYWDCSVLSDETIRVPMAEYNATGAYIKFRLMLPKVYEITEIMLTPYCIHPVDICSISIGDKNILSAEESFIDTFVIRIPKMATDEIVFIMRQSNYIYEDIQVNGKVQEAEDLFNNIINEKYDSYVDSEDIVSKYINKHEEQVTQWNKAYIRNNNIR
jgi:hypothetical protein